MSGSYTHIKIDEIENSAPGLGAESFQESYFATPELGSEDVGATLHRYVPGKRQGFAHRHRHAEEFYVVIKGSGRVKLDDDILELAPLDTLRLDPGVLRCWEAGPDGMEVIAFGARNRGDGERIPSDAEIVPDWWTD